MGLIRAVIVLVAGASALNAAQAAEVANADATSLEQEAALLVQAMEMEPSARKALEAKSENAIKQGRANPAELDCIRKMDLGFVGQIYASAFAKTLTLEEIQQATKFFGTPAGQEYLQYALNEQFRQG
jgi:Tfp pilus assembly protein PilV